MYANSLSRKKNLDLNLQFNKSKEKNLKTFISIKICTTPSTFLTKKLMFVTVMTKMLALPFLHEKVTLVYITIE